MRSRLRLTVILTGIFVVLTAIQYYIGWHIWVFLSTVFHLESSVLYWAMYWIVAYSYLLARLLSRVLPRFLYRVLKVVGSYWFAVLLYAILLLPVADLIALVLRLSNTASSDTIVIVLGILSVLIFAGLVLRGSWNAWNPVIRRFEVTIPKPAGKWERLTIAVASDLHLGTIVGNAYLGVLVERINGLKPDLILFPGDVIDDEIEPFIRERMGEVLQKLQATLGKYAVLGNHEYIGGHIDEFERQMTASGIELLMDRSVKIDDSLYLIGRKDRAVERFGKGSRMELDELLDGIDRSLPLIMMDHQPYHLDQASSSGIDVMLSGHTHRGQMAPNHWITGRLFELDWGYVQKGGLHAIVSSGFGTWGPPIRLGSRSEIIELIIHFQPS
ncbi:metallophosphoesterase [Paenibacillus allorhizosphaerae]|uniref:Calcineurin-like phosphoesterase domain-containing protein n=1 Tax=Paenibacillus allorhizosphaerae TaxID=2849866 RepID=A0ABM8VCN0_9BACL|nr:metallophosphoesterase [Paenibacillus allorhizosphaerae]CAG7624406.1 hypothetical protein PAECIP111802_01061 [Paenibacillus allorhizosphaerae]